MRSTLLIDASPWWVLGCALAAFLISWFLYRAKHPWSKGWNRALAILRGLVLFVIFFLLLDPTLKYISSTVEKSLYLLVIDDSESMQLRGDTTLLRSQINGLQAQRTLLEDQGFEVVTLNLAGEPTTQPAFKRTSTDLSGALERLVTTYEGRQLGGVLLVTDGIYTVGSSPGNRQFPFPVSVFATGDSLVRPDVQVQSVLTNRIAYQGSQFPVRAEVILRGIDSRTVQVNLNRGGQRLERREVQLKEGLNIIDFTVAAEVSGMQNFQVQVEALTEEENKRNNARSAYTEVVKGRKQILIAAAAPHPDIKALRAVLETNVNYEIKLHIPGVTELPADQLNPEGYDLLIFHQIPDLNGATRNLAAQLSKTTKPMLVIYGSQTDLKALASWKLPIQFEAGRSREVDEVFMRINPDFQPFQTEPSTISRVSKYPPVLVPFGKTVAVPGAEVFAFQRIGNVETQRPLIALHSINGVKLGMIAGEGLWQWRMNEYLNYEEFTAFQEVMGKLVQNLSTVEDKRRFRVFPLQQEYLEGQPVFLEAQLYNENYELLSGYQVDLTLTDEKAEKKTYRFVPGPGSGQYRVGALPKGIYRFTASTPNQQDVRGEFIVRERDSEQLNLVADFAMLRNLASTTGGKFYHGNMLKLEADWSTLQAEGRLITTEKLDPLLNLWWLFALLAAWLSMEWIARKYWGGY